MGDQTPPLDSNQEESDTNTSHRSGQYNMYNSKNDGPLQGQVSSDHDVVPLHATKNYMILRGPEAYSVLTEPPGEQWDTPAFGKETVEDLRTKLLRGAKLKQPVPITVTGTLFPCALLTTGWWDTNNKIDKHIEWRNKVQEWLFHGFDLWGPSWDFTWGFDHWEESQTRDYFIAQLGDGDEANSLPVLIPNSKAQRLREDLHKWGGVEAEITCVLGHRDHFTRNFDASLIELYRRAPDYCLWIDEDDKKHGIHPTREHTDVYSGYLWKCVAPKQWLIDGKPSIKDVYFVWEHANWASTDTVAYSLEALEQKEAYIQHRFGDGDLVLLQKSSSLVPGEPLWKDQEFYAMLRRNPTI
jgi:hypothetical protein